MNRSDGDLRDGEVLFPEADRIADDAGLRFIGSVRTPWRERSSCPKNVAEARERHAPATLVVAARYRAALAGLDVGDRIVLLTWLDRARRDLALQMPRHASAPRGTFSLRSPVRPNPIGLHLVRITALDLATGEVGIDAIDVLDETPLLDIKPYLATVDVAPDGD